VAGVDIATGKGRDYFGVEVLDIDDQEQAAEMMIRTLPRHFKYLLDFIGRWYNNALLVVERNNGGDAFIDELRYELIYPNLWRKKDINDKPSQINRKRSLILAHYGFYTGSASKPTLNKALIDYLQPEGGYRIYSRRLLKQAQIYVRKKDRAGHDTDRTEAEDGPGNHDDLIIALGLGFIGAPDAAIQSTIGLLPFKESMNQDPMTQSTHLDVERVIQLAARGDPSVLMPMAGIVEVTPDHSVAAEMAKFMQQLGAAPMAQNMPSVSMRKHILGR
jgi:hypothetical protein